MINKQDYEKLLSDLKTEFPDFEIVNKSTSKLMGLIDKSLKLLTFGRFTKFMENFTTVIGNKVYVPKIWDAMSPATQFSTLQHERVHMRQAKRYGMFLYSLLYLFLPLPIGFAYFRMKFEMEAYEVTLKNIYFNFGKNAFNEELKKYFMNYFIGPDYLWMWPWKKRISNWYDKTVTKILKEDNGCN